MKHRMIIFLCSSQGDSFEIDRESSESTREQTPDSDSGYMASCVTVVSSTSSQNRTFQQSRTISNSHKPSVPTVQGIQANNEGSSATVVTHINAASNSRPNFLAEMQSAQQKRRLSKENISESASSSPSTNNVSQKDVPKRNLPVISHDHGEIQNAGKNNPMSNSLADQLKLRLEERRKNSDDSEAQNLAADVQKAVNIANESSKYNFYKCHDRKVIINLISVNILIALLILLRF